MLHRLFASALILAAFPVAAADVQALAAAVDAKVQAWRRDIHQHPELGNRETRTAKLVADHLRALGFDDVRTGIATTGVTAVLRGGKPGPRIAVRADMDALPVTERSGLPFESKVTTPVQRPDHRRHARLRPRRPHRHPDGRGRSAGRR